MDGPLNRLWLGYRLQYNVSSLQKHFRTTFSALPDLAHYPPLDYPTPKQFARIGQLD